MTDKTDGMRDGSRSSATNLRDLMSLEAFSESKEYWTRVSKMNGGGKGLKQIILSEHTGMGVVSALVATIIVSLLMLSPNSYNEDNFYNDQASIVYLILLCISLVASISTITLSFEVYAQTLKVPDDKIEWWVTHLKGRKTTECVVHMYTSLQMLVASIIALIYLLNGGKMFIISACILVPGIFLVFINNGTIHARFLAHILFPDKRQHIGVNQVAPAPDAS